MLSHQLCAAVLLCKVLDRRRIGEKLCDRCQGLLASQLPAPTVATASLWMVAGGSLLGERGILQLPFEFPPAETQCPHHSWGTSPGLL